MAAQLEPSVWDSQSEVLQVRWSWAVVLSLACVIAQPSDVTNLNWSPQEMPGTGPKTSTDIYEMPFRGLPYSLETTLKNWRNPEAPRDNTWQSLGLILSMVTVGAEMVDPAIPLSIWFQALKPSFLFSSSFSCKSLKLVEEAIRSLIIVSASRTESLPSPGFNGPRLHEPQVFDIITLTLFNVSDVL